MLQDTGQDFGALLKTMDRGLLVTELMGQGVNGVTGDYSRGVAGFWVENGAIAYPVEEITIAGNLKEIFAGIVAVGTDVVAPRLAAMRLDPDRAHDDRGRLMSRARSPHPRAPRPKGEGRLECQ